MKQLNETVKAEDKPFKYRDRNSVVDPEFDEVKEYEFNDLRNYNNGYKDY